MISRKIALGVIVFVLAASVFYFFFLEKKETRVCFKDKCFDVEIAANNEDRARGLMFREHLDRDSGMLFVYEKVGVYSFWMKNTLIPLDMIWMNEEKEVVYIQSNAAPCKTTQCPTYNPNKSALYVLELNGGVANESGIAIGDKSVF